MSSIWKTDTGILHKLRMWRIAVEYRSATNNLRFRDQHVPLLRSRWRVQIVHIDVDHNIHIPASIAHALHVKDEGWTQ